MYPKLRINLKQIYKNTKRVIEIASASGITVTGITKCTASNIEIAETMLKAGVNVLGDSRIQNLKHIADIPCEKWLIRSPMLSEIDDTITYADLSLNSELITVEALNEAARKQDKIHDILLMVDLGDLREGYFNGDELIVDTRNILNLENIHLRGIGANLSCTGAVVPTPETYEKFEHLQQRLVNECGYTCEITSGGATSSLYLAENKTMPLSVNNLRIGEFILIGTDTCDSLIDPQLHTDNFILDVQIIEIKEKPSLPIGKIAKDAFGNTPVFKDKGIRRRAICAVGKQDTTIDGLTPLDTALEIIAASSDHLIVDISESDYPYQIGDIISFRCSYTAALLASVSEYVEKMTV